MAKGPNSKLIILLISIAIPFYIAYSILAAFSMLIIENSSLLMIGSLTALILILVYQIYSNIYFSSSGFKAIKENIQDYINNCNELNDYIEELKGSYANIDSKKYGLGLMSDNSVYKFKRKEWSQLSQYKNVHHCSANICKNASTQPIKYLCKYFDIAPNEESLIRFENVLNDFTSVEQGKVLINQERELIYNKISGSIPFLIKQFSKTKLVRKLGFENVDISDTYIPIFTFLYISAGGNSSSRCDIKLNTENLNHLIKYLNEIISWTKSAAGQRALMTSQLRENIKKRDLYKCCYCGIGVDSEPNLLLEIDHKIPISKGGMTTLDNLQTLCWRCNRKKGSKLMA